MKLLLPAILPPNGIRSMVDGGFKLTFETNELSEDQALNLIRLKNSAGVLGFSPQLNVNDLDMDEKEIAKLIDNEKSPSQRLRGRMYAFYKETTGKDTSGFLAWYSKELDKIGEKYLEKLN
jgi:hypothetical protein